MLIFYVGSYFRIFYKGPHRTIYSKIKSASANSQRADWLRIETGVILIYGFSASLAGFAKFINFLQTVFL